VSESTAVPWRHRRASHEQAGAMQSHPKIDVMWIRCVCGHVPALHYRESAFMNEGRQSDEQTTLSVVRCLVIVLEA